MDTPVYRPLTTASYALDYAIGELAPAGYHVVNVLLHALAALLVLALAMDLALPPRAATLAAVLFAVHPIHVEVVANVAGRKDSLTTVFALAALLLHASALRRGRLTLLAAGAAPVALAAAMFSKETGVVTIGLIAVRDLLFGQGAWRSSRGRATALYTSYGAVLVLYLGARWAAVGSLGVALDRIPFCDNPIAHASPGVRVLTAVAILGRGLALLFVPATLSPDYSYRAIPAVTNASDPRFLLAAASLVIAGALAFRARRRWPLGLFALLWYGAAIAPGSNLLFPVGTIFGERLLYLPSVAFCLAAGGMLCGLLATPIAPAVRWAAVAAAVALAARTVTYAGLWSDDLTLFSAGVRAQPVSSKLHEYLGSALLERGRAGDAAKEFQLAIQLFRETPTTFPRAWVYLGNVYERLGRLEDAERIFEQVPQGDPGYPDALYGLGLIRRDQGRQGEAASLWRLTIAANPRHAGALSDLGTAQFLSGDQRGAKSLWERATAVDPRLPTPWYNLAALYEADGDLERARKAWREFLRYASQDYAQERALVAEKLRAAGAIH